MKQYNWSVKLLGLLLLLLVLFSCGTPRSHLVERLFLEREQITIYHPEGTGSKASRVLSEQVTFTQVEKIQEGVDGLSDANRVDTNRVYTLPEVKVTSRTRFTSVRQGFVDVDFVIHVPRQFISDDYQVCLTPELFQNDSVIRLGDVVLRGENFVKKQETDYAEYEKYLAGVVDAGGYDSIFVDRKGLNRDISNRRKLGMDDYYNRWALVNEYWQWRYKKEEEYTRRNVLQDYQLSRRLESSRQKYEKELLRRLSTGRDTASLSRAYRKECEALKRKYASNRELTLASVPQKYREIYLQGVRPEDVQPDIPLDKDSIRMAREHLLHDRIAMNEFKDSRKDAVFRQLVPYPYRPDAHYNLVISEGNNFTYRYTKRYPVKAGQKNIRICLKGLITATDRSAFNVRTDTLNYIISSLDELADGTLLVNETFTEEDRRDYNQALQLLRGREYEHALNILTRYKDYNTALVLACLGENRQAHSLLVQLPATAKTLYLLQIADYKILNLL